MIMKEESAWAAGEALVRARHRLPIAVLGNALMRISSGASGVLVGLYLADLANRGSEVNAALIGTLGALSFAAAGAPPLLAHITDVTDRDPALRLAR